MLRRSLQLACALLLITACAELAIYAPVPAYKDEPKSRGGNKSPYTVFGESYDILDSAVGYKETGIASWYGKKFHGRLTSNGERYDMYAISAAHKSLPIPTFVKVTNTENGKTLLVRVNDRGPFHEGRIIDLSYAAALKLGFADKGVVKVTVEAITSKQQAAAKPRVLVASVPVKTSVATSLPLKPIAKAKPVQAPVLKPLVDKPKTSSVSNVPKPQIEASIKRYLQVGVYSDESTARQVASELSTTIKASVIYKPATKAGLFNVLVGPVVSEAASERVRAVLLFHGIEEVFTVYDFD